MKNSAIIKHCSVAALALGVAVACATAPEEEEECVGITEDAQVAVDEARAVVQEAREMGAEWRGARRMTNQAESVGADCNESEAIQIAAEAEQMARNAMDQYRAEQEALEEEPDMGSYTVRRGDSLWRISGMSDVYGDSYQWPLIYRANAEDIHDPDLIYPDQELQYEMDPSAGDVDAAIDHARTRGEWSLGEPTASDRDYLRNHGW